MVNEMKNELINNEIYKRIKDYSKSKKQITKHETITIK